MNIAVAKHTCSDIPDDCHAAIHCAPRVNIARDSSVQLFVWISLHAVAHPLLRSPPVNVSASTVWALPFLIGGVYRRHH